MWHVVYDAEDGYYLTEDPDEGDEVVFSSDSQFEAEVALCRQINLSGE
jgi:hypothetical protein